MRDDPATRLRNNATEVASLLVTGLWLALLVSGVGGSLWLAVLLLGYIVVVPLVALLYGDEADIEEWWDEDERERLDVGDEALPERVDSQTRDALETLRNRYAAGELTDEQFEYKLERLLEVETVEDAAAWRRSRDADPDDGDRARDRREDRDRDLEYET